MKCPYCGSLETYVSSGMNVKDGYRRYRKCSDCNRNFISTEVYIPVKRGKPRNMSHCKWCGRELKSWFLIYKGYKFCRYNDDACLKNYLFEEAEKDIEEDRANGDVEYDMNEVCDRDGL